MSSRYQEPRIGSNAPFQLPVSTVGCFASALSRRTSINSLIGIPPPRSKTSLLDIYLLRFFRAHTPSACPQSEQDYSPLASRIAVSVRSSHVLRDLNSISAECDLSAGKKLTK